MKTAAVLSIAMMSAAAVPNSQSARSTLMAQIKDRLALPRCAGPGDTTSCVVNRARKLIQHEGFLSEMAQRHAPEHAGLLRSLLALPRFVATGVGPDPTGRRSLLNFWEQGAAGKGPKIQDAYEKLEASLINSANNTCEGRYELLVSKVFRDSDGCQALTAMGDSNFDGEGEETAPTPAPAPTPGLEVEDSMSCDEGSAMGDSMYYGYTCNYELQPLGCKASKDDICHTDNPVTRRDGNWAEQVFVDDECEMPGEQGFNEDEHGEGGIGGSKDCKGKWPSMVPERFSQEIQSTEEQCPDFATRAYNDAITVSKRSAVETCSQALSRSARRNEFAPVRAVVVPTSLTGFSVATFTEGVQLAYRIAMAIEMSVTVDKVRIKNIVDTAGRRRLSNGRKLADGAVQFDLEIYVADKTAAKKMIETAKAVQPAALQSQFVTQLTAVKASGEHADVASMTTVRRNALVELLRVATRASANDSSPS